MLTLPHYCGAAGRPRQRQRQSGVECKTKSAHGSNGSRRRGNRKQPWGGETGSKLVRRTAHPPTGPREKQTSHIRATERFQYERREHSLLARDSTEASSVMQWHVGRRSLGTQQGALSECTACASQDVAGTRLRKFYSAYPLSKRSHHGAESEVSYIAMSPVMRAITQNFRIDWYTPEALSALNEILPCTVILHPNKRVNTDCVTFHTSTATAALKLAPAPTRCGIGALALVNMGCSLGHRPLVAFPSSGVSACTRQTAKASNPAGGMPYCWATSKVGRHSNSLCCWGGALKTAAGCGREARHLGHWDVARLT